LEIKGKKILIVGLGRAGLAAARFAVGRGAQVTITDAKPAEMLERFMGELPEEVHTELGGHREESFTEADLIVVSPGVPPIDELRAAEAASVEVIDEAELAARYISGDLVGVTGTNGKSTTTVLLAKMLERLDRPVFAGGNLGVSLIRCADTEAAGPDGIVVAELSSFQLQRAPTIRPRVAVLLNIDEDHLDRHADMEEYAAAKARIFANQSSSDFAVVNGDQPACLEAARLGNGRLLAFRDTKSVEEGAFLSGDELVIRPPEGEELRIPGSIVALTGRHNLSNALAACLTASLFGVSAKAMREALSSFRGLAHRMQEVGVVDGVRYYDDSKATNVSSAVGSLSGLDDRFVLIGGGKHKGSSYAPLRPVLEERCEGIVLIGQAAEQMERELAGAAPIERAGDMTEAVEKGASLARPGVAVVLCPACSSYDMFRDFEERGDAFARAVLDRKEAASSDGSGLPESERRRS
jgi:UDP-N-acetylmuramoylalanine--D-glutamate ligase